MCGLCGIAGPGINTWDVDNFKQLLYVTALRGKHGTGIAKIGTNKTDVEVLKSAFDASYFINQDEARKAPIIKSVQVAAYMGHCRWATKGAVTSNNAHPFDTGRLVSAHNGTLTDKEFEDANKTDSEMMFSKMETDGIGPVLRNLEYASAYAISIWSKRTKRLYLARNTHRGLYGVFLKSRSVFYWSSEYHMLKLILSRNQESYHDIRYLSPDTLYSVDPMTINSSKEYDNWMIEDVAWRPTYRTPIIPNTDKDWADLIAEEMGKEDAKGKSKILVHPKSSITPENHIPEFLRNPTKKNEQSVSSEFDNCFRCGQPLTENEAFTCQSCKSKAGQSLHDVQSTDERAA